MIVRNARRTGHSGRLSPEKKNTSDAEKCKETFERRLKSHEDSQTVVVLHRFPRGDAFQSLLHAFFSLCVPLNGPHQQEKKKKLIADFKRTLACACVFTMRLGATFFRRKELVEPAVDLAKEMDCIEAAIFS